LFQDLSAPPADDIAPERGAKWDHDPISRGPLNHGLIKHVL